MKKEFFDKVKREGLVKTKKYVYKYEKSQYINKYDLKDEFIDCVWVDTESLLELKKETSLKNTEESKDTFLKNTEELNLEDASLHDVMGGIENFLFQQRENIRHSLQKANENFVNIAWYLRETKVRIEKEKCEITIDEWAKKEFGFTRSTTNDYIRVAYRFCEQDTKQTIRLKNEYSGYSISQLFAMLPCNDSEWLSTEIKPDDTVRDIKRKVKEKNGEKNNEQTKICGSTSSNVQDNVQIKNEVKSPIVSLNEIKVTNLFRIRNIQEYHDILDKLDEKIELLLNQNKGEIVVNLETAK